MNKPSYINVVDEIQAAEKRHYVALQIYDRALRNLTAPEILQGLKLEVCEAFADLKVAHDRLMACDAGEVANN